MGQVVTANPNPAAPMRGSAHSARTGTTPALDPAEARALLSQVRKKIDAKDRAKPAGAQWGNYE